MRKSAYIFEVRVNGHKVPEYFNQNEFWIEGRKNSEYSLYFKNFSSKRILVVPSVDGLSVFDGKPASDQSRGYVIDGYGEINIPGWTIDDSKVAAFQFRPKGDKANPTYVESLNKAGIDVDAGNQGVLGVMVFQEKQNMFINNTNHYRTLHIPPINYNYTGIGGGTRSSLGPISKDYDVNTFHNYGTGMGLNSWGMTSSFSVGDVDSAATMDFYDPNAPVATAAVDSSLGTGMGQDKTFQTQETTFDRDLAKAVTMLIQYDTLQGLQKRGIMVKPVTPFNKAFPAARTGCLDTR